MNEIYFFLDILVIIVFVFLALKLNKNYLIALIVVQSLIANLFVVKQITLFNQMVTASDIFIVGIILSENLLQEYFGKKEARKAIYLSFFTLLFFLIVSKIHMLYIPNKFDIANEAFRVILKNNLRIILSSIFVFFLVQRVDIFIFSFFKKIFNERYLSLRLFLSNSLSQLIDTVLFSFIALYGVIGKIYDVMLFSFLIKIIVISIIAPFMSFTKKIIKKERLSV
jgi:hypothetical protein